MVKFTDKQLGMDRSITRRDFLNGIAMIAGGSMLAHPAACLGQAASAVTATEPQNAPDYYPPALTGLRGSHLGALEVAHALRDGTFWPKAGDPVVTNEQYDLVVVGGGISGLAAAYAFRQVAGPRSRILILENHDDFGGHAKRNEFSIGGTELLGYGGSSSIMSPLPYSGEAKKMLVELGIAPASYSQFEDPKVFASRSMGPKVFFDQETFGSDKITVDPHQYRSTMQASQKEDLWKRFTEQSPLPEQGNADVKRLYESDEDVMPGVSSAEKKTKLAKVSYADFLSDTFKVDPSVVQLMNNRMIDPYGVGAEAIPAQDAWGMGMPGFSGMKLDPGAGPGMGRNAMRPVGGGMEYFHFPDGNASIARLLVRKLLADAIPGRTSEDIVTAKVRYDKLDQPKNDIRIRLNSTVVRVKHLGEVASAKEVEVAYVEKGTLCTVRAANCVLACWNAAIPFINNETSAEQKSALAATDKLPMVYANVAVTNWDAFAKLGADSFYAPSSYWSSIALDERVSMGGYQATKKTDEPILVTMRHFPCSPGLPSRSQHRAGRAELYGTSFDTMERNARDQLARSLAGTDFDPARDIAAVTINRWGHGRTYQYNSLWDPFWIEGKALPCKQARKSFGRIAIANSDSDAYGWADSAINQAFRAINDLQIKNAGA